MSNDSQLNYALAAVDIQRLASRKFAFHGVDIGSSDIHRRGDLPNWQARCHVFEEVRRSCPTRLSSGRGGTPSLRTRYRNP